MPLSFLPPSSETSALGRAWVSDGDRVYVAHAGRPSRAPFSPVTELIQGIYQLQASQARRILRGRIFTDCAPSLMCLAMVKVAAKRLTHDPEQHPPPGLATIDVTDRERYEAPRVEELWALASSSSGVDQTTDLAFMRLARELAGFGGAPIASLPRYARDRPVAAILVSAEGEVLWGARNTGSVNRALHAEVNLVQSWYRARGSALPVDSRIYVTLKCCRMCAAMIWQAAADVRRLRVYFGEDDPGPNARATTLDIGSFDRARAAGAPDGEAALLSLELQYSLAENRD